MRVPKYGARRHTPRANSQRPNAEVDPRRQDSRTGPNEVVFVNARNCKPEGDEGHAVTDLRWRIDRLQWEYAVMQNESLEALLWKPR